MSYRPICDTWILARSKVKYYGAYPAGFLERARDLMGVALADPVLHVCGGRVREYPYPQWALGPHDRTLDLDPAMSPDYLQDAREPFPWCIDGEQQYKPGKQVPWSAVLIDRPYTEEDADHYAPGRAVLPSANLLLKNALDVVAVGSKVGILDYVWPQPPSSTLSKLSALVEGEEDERVALAKEVAVISVLTGRNNRARVFSVWRKLR